MPSLTLQRLHVLHVARGITTRRAMDFEIPTANATSARATSSVCRVAKLAPLFVLKSHFSLRRCIKRRSLTRIYFNRDERTK